MNSLERVLATISHKEPDRVPIGEWGIDHDHVGRILGRSTYWRNRKDTTIAIWQGRRDEVIEGMKTDYVELIEKLDYDVIPVHVVEPKGYRHPDPPKQTGEGLWEDSQGGIYKYAASNDSIMHMTRPPARNDISTEEVEKAIDEIPTFDDGEFELVDHVCKKFGSTKAIVFRGVSVDGLMLHFFGGDDVHRLTMPLINPEAVIKAGEYAIAYNKRLIAQCVKRDIPIIMGGRDYGHSTGCIESPKTIRNLYMPFHKRLTDEILKHGKIPFLHCCGCVWEIMDDLVMAGYQGYQSIQGSAGMDLSKVKRLYGDKLTLWAGVQCETLVEGTIEQTVDEVRKSLEICMPKGGFIFGSTNSVQYGASTDNYLRALEVVRKYGNYS